MAKLSKGMDNVNNIYWVLIIYSRHYVTIRQTIYNLHKILTIMNYLEVKKKEIKQQ